MICLVTLVTILASLGVIARFGKHDLRGSQTTSGRTGRMHRDQTGLR
jgi:hypothetical protein